MPFRLILILVLALSACKNETTTTKDLKTTHFYFVRHAEKDLTTKNNPELTDQGYKRANDLATYFADKHITKVYSTNTKRTINTALPTAKSINSKPIVYDAKTINIKDFMSTNKGENVLIVGHSNTIPFFVNAVINKDVYKEIDERIYNDVFIVTIENNKLTHQKIKVN